VVVVRISDHFCMWRCQDRYVIANTSRTIIIGDLTTQLVSEVPWTTSGKEKYFFDYPTLCMVYNVGELSLVEYGSNEVLGCCRTEYMNPRLIRYGLSGVNSCAASQ
jgi:intraflagellar transport protein 172